MRFIREFEEAIGLKKYRFFGVISKVSIRVVRRRSFSIFTERLFQFFCLI
jgi:hypothetical protein